MHCIVVHGIDIQHGTDGAIREEKGAKMEWIVEAEDLDDLMHGRYSLSTKPLVRCWDCKFWQDQEEGVVEVPICARPQNKFEKHPMVMIIGADGFCSFGKRREDE